MCLAIPAKVISIEKDRAVVDMLGNTVTADTSLLEDVKTGDYILVHAGFGIQKYDEEEANLTLSVLKEMVEKVSHEPA